MPRKPCYWTRKLELELVEFVRQRDFIWKPYNNTNYQIQLKYKAYAEFAAKLGRGYSARTVRDRWVNIRSTFNHNLRRVDRSKEVAIAPTEVFVPCWPLWKPMQFLREVKKDDANNFEACPPTHEEIIEEQNNVIVKNESQSDIEDLQIGIRQRGKRTDRPRHRLKSPLKRNKKANKCIGFVDDLLRAMKPISSIHSSETNEQFWFFGRHVTERLNAMREVDSTSASRDILAFLNSCNHVNGVSIKSEGESSE